MDVAERRRLWPSAVSAMTPHELRHICRLVKALWQAETPQEQTLARAVTSKVLARRSSEAVEKARKLPPRARRNAPGGAAASGLVCA